MRLILGLLFGLPLMAGPPLICERIEIGGANSLPWKNVEGWGGADPSYSLQRLTGDTLRLLDRTAPLPVRMETMRRAAIYAAQDPRLAVKITLRLAARVLDGGGTDALAWFDAGYFVETVRQSAVVYQFDMLSPGEKAKWKRRIGIPGMNGRKWVEQAIRLGGKGMEPGLARMAD